jgi:hypothetical protein
VGQAYFISDRTDMTEMTDRRTGRMTVAGSTADIMGVLWASRG